MMFSVLTRRISKQNLHLNPRKQKLGGIVHHSFEETDIMLKVRKRTINIWKRKRILDYNSDELIECRRQMMEDGNRQEYMDLLEGSAIYLNPLIDWLLEKGYY